VTADLEPDWDPDKKARVYLRHAQSGELGWLVRRAGKSVVRLDRPNQEVTRRYVQSEWLAEETQRPLAPIHAARIAFEADRALCREVGLPLHAKREWGSLRDGERQLFIKAGPKDPPARAQLYAAIMGAMAPYVRADGGR
jgi:hypothetical protein